MECESNPWCLFCRLGAPEQSPDVLEAEPWDRGVLCGHWAHFGIGGAHQSIHFTGEGAEW